MRTSRFFSQSARLLSSIVLAAAVALSPADVAPDGAPHPFVNSLREKNADGLLILLPPAGPGADEVRAIFTEAALQPVAPGIKVLLVDPQSASLEDRALIKKYGLGDYATSVIIDSAGRPYYSDLGIPASVAEAGKLLAAGREIKKRRDEALEGWKTQSENIQKAAGFLDTALSVIPADYLAGFYAEEAGALIAKAGADSPTGKKYTSLLASQRRDYLIREILDSTHERTSADGTIEEFLKNLDGEIAKRNPPPNVRQLAEMHRFRYLAQAQRFEAALKALEAAEAIDPKSEVAANIPRFKDRMKAAIERKKTPEQPEPAKEGKAEKKKP